MIRPISLKLRGAEVTTRAKESLRRFALEKAQQDRVKSLAIKSLEAIYEMNAAATPKVKSLSAGEQRYWRNQYQTLVDILLRIHERGA